MNKIFLSLGIVMIVASIFFAVQPKTVSGIGSGFQTNSAKVVTNTNASSTSSYVVRGGSGVLSGVVINKMASSTNVRIYDGTATSTGTLIGTIYASSTYNTTERNIDFNVAVVKGIVLDIPAGFAGDYTILSN